MKTKLAGRSIIFRLLGLSLVGFLFPACIMSIADWESDANYTTRKFSQVSGDEQSIEANVRLNVGKLEIEAGDSSDAYQLEVYYDEAAFEPKVDFHRQGGVAYFDVELSGEGKFTRRIRKTRMNLRFNPETTLRLETRTGVGESQIDLTGLRVESVTLESGVGETSLAMLEPNRSSCDRLSIRNGVGHLAVTGLGNFGFQKFDFEGGVGAATLDFSGSWDRGGEVEIRVGVGGIEIRLPRSLGAEVRMSKSFLSGIDISGFRKEGNTYYSDNIDRVDRIVRIQIRAGIGGVEIDWI